MTDHAPPLNGSRLRQLVSEGTVIVVSILLAFAIDAWWDDRQELKDTRLQLALLAEQMAENQSRLMEINDGLERSIDAMQSLVETIRPNPPDLARDSLAVLLGAAFTYPSPDLELASVEAVLTGVPARAVLASGAYEDLLRFRATASYFEQNFALLREQREEAFGYLIETAPVVSLLYSPAGDPDAFPASMTRVLSDPRLEGLILNKLIRAQNVYRRSQELAGRADAIQTALSQSGSS